MRQPGVYILQSLKSGGYYVGSTDDLAKRLHQHNRGWVKATRSLRPWVVKAFIPCDSLAGARQDEFRLKRYKRRDVIEKVIADRIFPWHYARP